VAATVWACVGMRRRLRPGAAPLWLRLAIAFVLVAVAGVALLAGLTLASTNSQVASLDREQERETTASVVAAVAAAYRQAGGWARAELDSALVVAGEAGVTIAIFDQAHHRLAGGLNQPSGSQTGPGSTTDTSAGPVVTVPVVVAGHAVGSVALGFRGSGLRTAVAALRNRLIETVGIGAGCAALLALAVALVVARRITRPVAALTRVARARESGDRDARVGRVKAPGELDELAMAFDRMADAVSREDELRRALVADVAHELRTPISVLQGSCEALLDGVLEPTPDVISSIHDEVLRLATRVEDLQVLAAAEAAGLRMTAKPVDLAQVAGEAAAALAPRFEAADVELVTELESVTVSGDHARLHQIVTNLLTNTVKFTPAGGKARLEVAPAGGTARLKLTDSGPGMSAEELTHIFDRFWRGETATTTPGSGIGLAVVAELVKAHRGTIETDSEPGRGTTFVVSLPRV
jgi:signal transduction histidine kinase